MKLVYKETGKPVKVGDSVPLKDGSAEVTYFREPHKPSSEGKVSVRYPGAIHSAEYYVSVIGAQWIERQDRRE